MSAAPEPAFARAYVALSRQAFGVECRRAYTHASLDLETLSPNPTTPYSPQTTPETTALIGTVPTRNGSYSGANVNLSHTLQPLPLLMTLQAGLVNTWNEWDQLEEIIVGTASMAVIPPIEPALILKSELHSGFI